MSTVTVSAPVFFRNTDRVFTPRKGFEAALLLAIGTEMLSASEILARLTDSGLYGDVAPKALANRPLKPIAFLLKTWTAAGVLKTAKG